MRTTCIIVLLQSAQIVVSFVNLSVNKSADMSTSQYSDKWLADEAVDGDVSQDVQDNSCAVTMYGFFPEAWWRVDLGDVYVVNSVRIYNRRASPSVTYRLSGFSLYVSDTSNWQNGALCYLDNNGLQSNPGPSDVLTVPCNATGRYVTLYKERKGACLRPNLPQYCVQLELCEVQALGCNDGTFGASCENNCSGNCLNGETCNKAHGGCDNGCTAGYYGFRCDKGYTFCMNLSSKYQSGYHVCNTGLFGLNCSGLCGKCFNSSCEINDGSCPYGCIAGWKGFYCDETCDDREFGPGCSEKCNEHCFGGLCDAIHGTCHFGCIDGWTGDLCNEGCRRGFFGPNCSKSCLECSESCHHQTGECLGVCRDITPSANNSNTSVIILIVTNVLTVIALVTLVFLFCPHVRKTTNNSPRLQTQQDSSTSPVLPANRSVRGTAYQQGTGNGSTGNTENRTYEGLQMNSTDTNTYDILQTERNVTYINAQLI